MLTSTSRSTNVLSKCLFYLEFIDMIDILVISIRHTTGGCKDGYCTTFGKGMTWYRKKIQKQKKRDIVILITNIRVYTSCSCIH